MTARAALAPIRVLVVEDSLTVRRRLCETLAGDPGLAVAGETGDGREAIDLCARLRPDVVTMDMVLPGASGLAATEHIMAHNPTPILIVSSSANRGDLLRTYDALAAGAVDVLDKPLGDEPDGDWERRLRAAVKLVSRIRVITHPRLRLGAPRAPGAREAHAGAPDAADGEPAAAIAIGASTGGPGAIVEVLRALPPVAAAPVLVAMHLGGPLGGAFADWLGGVVARPVAFARDGDALGALAGRVAVAPPDRHLTVRGGRLRLTEDPPLHSCRPSVDALFLSLASDLGARAAACLLTGMGADGAEGLLAIRRAGGATLAQDEATSVVYGMPREAARLGAAGRVLPLGEIGPALAALALGPREARP